MAAVLASMPPYTRYTTPSAEWNSAEWNSLVTTWDPVFNVNKLVFSHHFAIATEKLARDALEDHVKNPRNASLEKQPFELKTCTNLFQADAIRGIWYRIHPQVLEFEPFCSWFESIVKPRVSDSQQDPTQPMPQEISLTERAYYDIRMTEINQLAVKYLTANFIQLNAVPQNDLKYIVESHPGEIYIRIEKKIKPIKQSYTENQKAAGQLFAFAGLIIYVFFIKGSVI